VCVCYFPAVSQQFHRSRFARDIETEKDDLSIKILNRTGILIDIFRFLLTKYCIQIRLVKAFSD